MEEDRTILSNLVKEFEENELQIKEYEKNVNNLTEADVNDYNKRKIRNNEIREEIDKKWRVLI